MILFVRDLTVIDFSYLCAKRGMLGESYIVDVELHGGLDQTSMVLDFAKVKKVIKQAIDQLVDHKLAVPALSSALTMDSSAGLQRINFQSARGRISMAAPAQAIAAVSSDEINERSITAFLQQHITPLLPDNVQQLVFNLRPEASNSFYYHYSHGLKKHDGNCQRIAHGHRSTIQIYTDGMLTPRLNKYWCERWQDIYLGSAEDLCAAAALQHLTAGADDYSFRYQAAQGWFELTMPKTHCEIVPCDTTVECLAEYIAAELKQLDNTRQYKVVAYEGVGKGAIAVS
ncbi:6-pyruvoyl-tetrahydropterin synthase [Rheinheimera pacifica]|jgi:6-pyruvoyl-tetrahydropterin synthase|uniref:6-carboxytetrahydropterin synthase n=1 Tax=Rheinheimera pacifica TaxID=173990 RepID=UPI002166E307|nr:6-carboxytetrahydropterin synthase [Rheinheimera pacifica]MCS4308974.1 6-pyruvoyl-tetrahydropterin synthase [Rheinheimera pacifica]